MTTAFQPSSSLFARRNIASSPPDPSFRPAPRSPDSYGWARICQVVGNFFGGTLSVGVGPYTDDAGMDPGGNGIYVIEGWRIAERLATERDGDRKPAGVRRVEPCEEQGSCDFGGMLRAFDESMPEGLRLGELLDSVEVPAGELEVGDEVWLRDRGPILLRNPTPSHSTCWRHMRRAGEDTERETSRRRPGGAATQRDRQRHRIAPRRPSGGKHRGVRERGGW